MRMQKPASDRYNCRALTPATEECIIIPLIAQAGLLTVRPASHLRVSANTSGLLSPDCYRQVTRAFLFVHTSSAILSRYPGISSGSLRGAQLPTDNIRAIRYSISKTMTWSGFKVTLSEVSWPLRSNLYDLSEIMSLTCLTSTRPVLIMSLPVFVTSSELMT